MFQVSIFVSSKVPQQDIGTDSEHFGAAVGRVGRPNLRSESAPQPDHCGTRVVTEL